MFGKIISAFFLIVMGVALFFIDYFGPFSKMLEDDIEIVSGKKAARRRWKNDKYKLIEKFFYIGYLDKVKRWHYILFIIYVVAFLVCVIFGAILIITGNKNDLLRDIFIIGIVIAGLTSGIAAFDRFSLYKGNVVRRRPKKEGKNKSFRAFYIARRLGGRRNKTG